MDLVGVPGAGAFRPDVEVLGPALPTSPVNSTRICVKWGMGVFRMSVNSSDPPPGEAQPHRG